MRPDSLDRSSEAGSLFHHYFDGLAEFGRDDGRGHSRLAWTAEDRSTRNWFWLQAEGLGLVPEVDRNGNLWAWWGEPRRGTVATGSHLDTVIRGGAYDGALGVASAFGAVSSLLKSGFAPARPIAIVAFADEEGARFGTPTFGSKLMMGELDPAELMQRRAADGATLSEALSAAGIASQELGEDQARIALLDVFVEVHIEQGHDLVGLGMPLGMADRVWPHGRWRLDLRGESNHAGTTRMQERRDPMQVAATAIQAARQLAIHSGAAATVGKLTVEPNSANSIPDHVSLWLDLRARDDNSVDSILEAWSARVSAAATKHRVSFEITREARSRGIEFAPELRRRVAALAGTDRPLPELSTAAGHDAAVLGSRIPTAMIFVRNSSGISHAPAEHADEEACIEGVHLLSKVLEDLASEPAVQ